MDDVKQRVGHMPAHVQAQIDQIEWFHHYDEATFGFATAGKKGVKNREEARLWGFSPHLFCGKSVLDVGAWDGYFSFLAEKMGARRVLATDHFCWSGQGWGNKAGFDLVHGLLNSRVESQDIDVQAISPATVGTFDVVLFLGVLYHLPDPIAGLQAMADVTNEVLIIETTYEKLDENKALFEWRPERLRSDPTNYWSPNIRGLSEVLMTLLKFRKVVIKPWADDRIICFAYK